MNPSNLQNLALRAAYMADLKTRAAAEEARVAEIKKINDAKIAAYLKAAEPVSEPVSEPAPKAAKVKAAKVKAVKAKEEPAPKAAKVKAVKAKEEPAPKAAKVKAVKVKTAKVDEPNAEKEKIENSNNKKQGKASIPKKVKCDVWNTYIGADIIKHRCLCCKKTIISNTEFDAGHVVSESSGGNLEIGNLRPICAACNHSMGARNMVDFVKQFGYYIG